MTFFPIQTMHIRCRLVQMITYIVLKLPGLDGRLSLVPSSITKYHAMASKIITIVAKRTGPVCRFDGVQQVWNCSQIY